MYYPLLEYPHQQRIRLRLNRQPSFALSTMCAILAACGSLPPLAPSNAHLTKDTPRVAPIATTGSDIPSPVTSTVMLPRPKHAAKVETYSVSVRTIPVQELLFALARDARLNVDIYPGINGVVTLNAIEQTLQQILTRIAKQVDMRWEIDGPNLLVMPDTPFLRNYRIDYVNISREVSGSVSINTQIASTSSSVTAGSTATSNSSNTSVKSLTQNRFWESIERNLKEILHETDKIMPEGSSETTIERSDQQTLSGTPTTPASTARAPQNAPAASQGANMQQNLQQQGTTIVKRTTFREAASVIVNPEAGVVIVRATGRQHEKVQEYLDMVMGNARRQVLIEATIAEVSLNRQYQQGINWQSLRNLKWGDWSGSLSIAKATPEITGSPWLLNLAIPKQGIATTLSLLETFGTVKVLSSPKLSVLNNQTAMLKVVDNVVFFQIKSDTTTASSGIATTTYTSTPQSVSVGLVMSVTPQISESGSILLNVRPTISSLKGAGKTDPTPGLIIANVVPEIQTREMESMLRLSDGEVAVMGGLMEDKLNNSTDAIPGLGNMPGIGALFRNRNDSTVKTELVILLRPTVIRDPSIDGDYRDFRAFAPTREFFSAPAAATPPLARPKP